MSETTIQLGTTVYGAEINWDTGVMTVLWAIQVFTGADSENWDLSGNSKRVNSPLISGVIEKPADNNTVGHIISDKFKALTANETYTGSQGAGISIDAGNGIINVNDGTGSMTVAAWKTYLASNPLQVEYELATPTTIQLTPEQLEMLKGYNRVTVASGYATIELKALVLGGDN